MVNKRMTAPNTFTKGLVMDFNPTVTKSDCLVNALNATLLTFNGNEMQLQQDMGNGRVETAFLPEGYVPVGACEFGDIIYIVSYNPLENKSQIGCFPSPERNITSDEITDLKQTLTASDFQELKDSIPTGVVKSMSVKKIVYGNKNMNPGDKFIIYEEAASDNSVLNVNKDTLSDYGNILHNHNEWPKLLKLKVVSIEDSGRIVDLNASVKWYDNDYYLTHLQTQPAQSKPDIDSYRSLVSSAYSVFQSKVSGKLAILAELESIDGFSCTYDVHTELNPTTNEMLYKIYFYTAWETRHNDINPSGFIFTKSDWSKDADSGFIYYPVLNVAGNYVEYIKDTTQTSLPIESAAVLLGNTPGYDFTKVKSYSRTYKLENPSSTFKSYINQDSYNAKITNILDWNKIGNSYTAIVNQNDYSNIRPVTRISRLINSASGEPLSVGGMYQYLYNLDSYSTNDLGQKVYYTKGNNGQFIRILPTTLKDDVVNNYFHKDIPMLITDNFKLPHKKQVKINGQDTFIKTDLTRLVWNYSVAPVMPYGVLDHLEITGNIDFSKLGTGLINLTSWKYYNSGNVSTLTWGLDAYTEPNKGIAEVVFDFFDNQGYAASYHIAGKSSYAGIFTEQIVLNQQNSSYKLNAVDAEGKTHIHAGVQDPEGTVYLDSDNKPVTTQTAFGPYKNDAGTLYPNMLYLVKITIKYCPKDIIGNFNTDNTSSYKTFYRWYWTNNMFNDSYYNVADFNILQPRLGLDFSATFDTRGVKGTHVLNPETFFYLGPNNFSYKEDSGNLYKSLSANVYAINQDYKDDASGNIRLTLNPGLLDGFNTFNLNEDKLSTISDVYIKMGKSSITKNIETPSVIREEKSDPSILDDFIQPVIAERLDSHEKGTGFDRSGYAGYNYGTNNSIVGDELLKLIQNSGIPHRNLGSYIEDSQTALGGEDIELYSTPHAYDRYFDSFSLNLSKGKLKTDKPLTYKDIQGTEHTLNYYQYQKLTLAEATEKSLGIQLTLAGISYSKMCASEILEDKASKVLKPMIHYADASKSYNSVKSVGLHLYKNHLYFNDVITFHMGESGGKNTRWGSYHSKNITDNTWMGTDIDGKALKRKHDDGWKPNFDHADVQELWKNQLTSPIAAFMICRSNSSNGEIERIESNVSWNTIRRDFDLPGLGNRITNAAWETPTQTPWEWTNDCHYIHSFMLYDQDQNLAVPIADYFISSGKPVVQDKRGMSIAVPTSSLADMLGSLFAQLYVIDDSAESDNGLLNNFISLQEFSEYWNKDIVVEIDTNSLDTQTKLQELVTIQTQTMLRYLGCLKTNMGQTYPTINNINLNNTTVVLYGTQRVLSFKYEVPYNLGELPYLNNQRKESRHKIMLSVLSKDGQPQIESFRGKVEPNSLYTWTGDNIIPFGQGTTMNFASRFYDIGGELYMTRSKRKIKNNSFAVLSKILKYEEGKVSWHNLTQFPSWNAGYHLKYRGSTEDYCHLEKLPLISFFNLYKPGL